MKKTKKIIATLALGSSLLFAGCQGEKNVEISLVDPNSPVRIGDTVSIKTNLSGFNNNIDPNDLNPSRGSEAWVENDQIKFKSNTPGTYSIYVMHDGVQSNILSIEVLNRDAISMNQEDSSTTSSQKPEEDLMDQIQDGDRVTVSQAIEKKDLLISKNVSVVMSGYLPLEGKLDASGVETPVLYDENRSNYILLKGFDAPFGNCKAEATGTLYQDSTGQLVMQMSYLYSTEEPVYKDKDKNEDKEDDGNSTTPHESPVEHPTPSNPDDPIINNPPQA